MKQGGLPCECIHRYTRQQVKLLNIHLYGVSCNEQKLRCRSLSTVRRYAQDTTRRNTFLPTVYYYTLWCDCPRTCIVSIDGTFLRYQHRSDKSQLLQRPAFKRRMFLASSLAPRARPCKNDAHWLAHFQFDNGQFAFKQRFGY